MAQASTDHLLYYCIKVISLGTLIYIDVFWSLLGSEKYSSTKNKKTKNKDTFSLLKKKENLNDFNKNGLKVLQFANYKVEEYNQGGKIRCYETIEILLEGGYDVKTLSFGLGKCDQLKNYHLEVDESSFFKEVKDGTISDWAICEYILKNEFLLLNLRKFTKEI